MAGTAHATKSGPGRRSGVPAVAAALAALLLSGTALVFAATTRTARPTGEAPAPSAGSCDATAVAARTMPSVVTLFVTGSTGGASNGSGEFLDPEGHVLTNNHVISSAVGGGDRRAASRGEELAATLVGRDIATDLAVIKVEPEGSGPADRFAGPAPRSAPRCSPSGLRAASPRRSPRGWSAAWNAASASPPTRAPPPCWSGHPDRRRDQPGQQRRPARRLLRRAGRRADRRRHRQRRGGAAVGGQHRARLRHPGRPRPAGSPPA